MSATSLILPLCFLVYLLFEPGSYVSLAGFEPSQVLFLGEASSLVPGWGFIVTLYPAWKSREWGSGVTDAFPSTLCATAQVPTSLLMNTALW